MIRDEQTNKDLVPLTELIKLYDIGFKLVPLGQDARTPAVESTKPIYDDPNYWTPERVERESYRFKNVATTFGLTRSGLYLNELDIDSANVANILSNLTSKEHGDYSMVLEMQKITYVVKTKKLFGYRFFWLSHKQNKPIHTQDCKPGHEFEIKTDDSAGHSTLPPSYHRNDFNFHYTKTGQDKLVVHDGLYDELVKILSDCRRSQKEEEQHTRIGITVELDDKMIQSICGLILPYYQKGSRYNIIFGLCGLLHKLVVSHESALNLIQRLTADDEERTSRIAVLDGTYNKKPEDVAGYSVLFKIFEKIIGDKTAVKKLLGNIINVIEQAVVNNEDQSLLLWLVDSITKEYTFRTTTDTEELFCYDGMKYVPGQEWRIKQHCQILCPTIRTAMVQEVINKIKQTTWIDRAEFDSNIDWVNMSNGAVNIFTGELRPHSPDQYFLSVLPYPYCRACKCPNILEFLGIVLRPRDVFTALQVFGYCLFKSARFHKALMCVGRGRNGKSVFLSLLEAFLDFDKNCSNATLQELCGGDRFANADLFGKLANIYADLKKRN